MNLWVFVFEFLMSLLCVWFGLYIYTRNRDSILSRTICFALVIFSIYPLGNGLMAVAQSSQETNWAKSITWWASPIAAALWLNVAVLLTANGIENKFVQIMKFVRWGILGVGILLGYLGVTTEFLYDFSSTRPASYEEGFMYGRYLIPTGQEPLDIFDIYLFSTLTLAMIMMIFRWLGNKRSDHREKTTFRLYTILSIFVFLAGVSNVVTYALRIYWATFFTDLIFFSVPIILAWVVSRETSISAKEKQGQDFLHSFLGLVVILFLLLLVPSLVAASLQDYLEIEINFIQLAFSGWLGVFLYMLSDDISLLITHLVARNDIEYHKKIMLMQEKGHRIKMIDDLPSATTIIYTYVTKELIRKIFTQSPNSKQDVVKTPLVKLACVNRKLVDMKAEIGKISHMEYLLAVRQVIEDAYLLLENDIVHIPSGEKQLFLDILKMKIFKSEKTKDAASTMKENETQFHRYYSRALHYLVMAVIYLETETESSVLDIHK